MEYRMACIVLVLIFKMVRIWLLFVHIDVH